LNEKKKKGLKDIELRLISELMRGSRRSDRELARTLKVSQPTVTRIRNRLEKEGIVKEYTMIPDLGKLGVEIVAITFGHWSTEKISEYSEGTRIQKAKQFISKHPNVVFASSGIGLGMGRMIVSVHKTYSDYVEFIREMRAEWAGLLTTLDSFITSVSVDAMPKQFTLSNLMEYLNPTSHDRIE
jgi:DNA-binding Lrp family transcriptional regulator